jgi:acetyl esterase/lipase
MSEDILDRPPPQAASRVHFGPEDPSHFFDVWHEWTPPRALVINIHGGFWRAAYTLEHASHFCKALSKLGLYVCNLEYRRVGDPGGGDPGTFDDVLLGTQRIVEMAGKKGLSALPLVFTGHSAGGHLALWTAARRKLPCAGVVAQAPVSDLAEARRLHLGRDAVDALIKPERIAWASLAALLPLGVRQIVVHGADDEIVPISMSREYVRKAVAAGDDAKLVALAGTGHFEVIDPLAPAFQHVVEAIDSLVKN